MRLLSVLRLQLAYFQMVAGEPALERSLTYCQDTKRVQWEAADKAWHVDIESTHKYHSVIQASLSLYVAEPPADRR